MRWLGTFVAFLAAFCLAFSFESGLGFTPIAGVALCTGFLARSHNFILVSSGLGLLAYLVTLQFFGQLLGDLPEDSVEGYAQVVVNAFALLLVLLVITGAARLVRLGYRKWRAA